MTPAVVWVRGKRKDARQHAVRTEVWDRGDYWTQTVCNRSLPRNQVTTVALEAWPSTHGGNCHWCVERLTTTGARR